jgi:hypothetical protein
MMSLILTRTLKIAAVLLIVAFIFSIGKNHGNLDEKDAFSDGIVLSVCTAILMILIC